MIQLDSNLSKSENNFGLPTKLLHTWTVKIVACGQKRDWERHVMVTY